MSYKPLTHFLQDAAFTHTSYTVFDYLVPSHQSPHNKQFQVYFLQSLRKYDSKITVPITYVVGILKIRKQTS